MKKEHIENKKYIISQIRQDKIIYAVEATATNAICLFAFMFSNQYLTGLLKDTVNIGILVIAVAYTLYMGVGNFYRHKRVKKLESEMSKYL